ncbi:GntP family permease [Caulobacter sp. 17J65-9]|uniref:GntP family permease n=1 Tax=Caulobacter sp. 17J65-9 TaxID=2709382 RepID=UPI0013C91F2F|nr:GntP family permease [Caulobacter sp. 17J65-9]NEX94331.1 GntP family permease [Caulobacter sp. 17J65-9]
MGLLGILLALAVLVWFAFRGWSVLLLAPIAALLAAAFSGQPLLASWTQTFMGGAAGFLAQFFPLFLVGAVFGKLMDDSGSVAAIARFLIHKLGPQRAVLAVVLAGAAVTYGGVSVFVAMFVLAPMAGALFQAAGVPRRLTPAAITLGTSTFTMSALPGTPAIQNAIPIAFLGTTPFAAPGLGVIASAVMLAVGLWWMARAETKARAAGEGYDGVACDVAGPPDLQRVRERAATAREFDPPELAHGRRSDLEPRLALAALPLFVVIGVNLLMSLVVLPRLDLGFLEAPRWGGVAPASVVGVWSVLVALTAAVATVVLVNRRRLPGLRESMDAGAHASALPALSVASLVGFGAVVAALPAFGVVRNHLIDLEVGPLVSLAVATNLLAALTGSASGGLTVALEALGPDFIQSAVAQGVDPALMHRVAAIGAGTLDLLPHNGAVVTLLAVCGCSHREAYRDIVGVGVLGAAAALVVVIALGSVFGAF